MIKNAIGIAIVIILLVIAFRIYDGSSATVKISEFAEVSIDQDTNFNIRPKAEASNNIDKSSEELILTTNEIQSQKEQNELTNPIVPNSRTSPCLAKDPPLICITGEYSD